MTGDLSNRSIPRHPRVWWSRLKVRWPFVVWLFAAGAAIFLYVESTDTVYFEGEVEARREHAAPVENARLIEVLVKPGDRVVAGQVLARFDSLITDAEMALEQIQAERQFSLAIFEAEAQLREMRLQQAGDEKRLEVFSAEVGRMEELVNAGLGELANLGYFRAEAAALAKTVELYPSVIKEFEQDVELARQRLEQVRGMLPDGATTSPKAEDARQSLLTAFREMNTLRSGTDGVVSRVMHRPGDVVVSGDPVVSVLLDSPPTVTALMPESFLRDIQVGSEVLVTRRGETRRDVMVKGVVATMSPDIVTVAMEVTAAQSGFPLPIDPNRPQPRFARGRQLSITLANASNLIPGETVLIYGDTPDWYDIAARVSQIFKGRNPQ